MITRETEYISVSENREMGITLILYKEFFYFALRYLNKKENPSKNELIVAFVLIVTGLEQYVKSRIMQEYQSHPDLLTEDTSITNSGLPKKFKERTKSIYPGKSFSHFNQPYEIFAEFSRNNKFKDLLRWLYQLIGLETFAYHSELSDFYELRSLFVHYWEFPLDAQKIDEKGQEIKLENEFEWKIESLNQEYFINVLEKVSLFLSNMNDKDLLKLINNIDNIVRRIKNAL